jgi:peroxiredoxin
MLKSIVLSLMIAFVALGETPKIGERAPQFSLPAATGSTVSLSDYAGKSKLVVVFYRGYW